jgi:hypothetical protein
MPNKNLAAQLISVEDQSYFKVFVFVEVLQTLSHWSSGQMFASHRRGQQFAPPGVHPLTETGTGIFLLVLSRTPVTPM